MKKSIFECVDEGLVSELFVDFDDTICIHREVIDWQNNPVKRDKRFADCIEGNYNYYINAQENGECAVLPGVSRLLLLCKRKGVPVRVLSYSTSNIYLRAKEKWISEVIGEDLICDVIGVSSPEGKVKFIEDFVRYRLSSLDPIEEINIAYVEDVPEIRRNAAKMRRVTVYSPQDVAASSFKLKEGR